MNEIGKLLGIGHIVLYTWRINRKLTMPKPFIETVSCELFHSIKQVQGASRIKNNPSFYQSYQGKDEQENELHKGRIPFESYRWLIFIEITDQTKQGKKYQPKNQ